MLQNKPIKVEDISQKEIMDQRRKLRNEMLKQLGERVAVTEEKAEKVLLRA
ncbi:hypothetical protein [Paenibacillus sp.]|uniref:hypothetical protein n=1 Tax=Paenibacillus sp. TaxID=58172 RepID=UPI0028A991BB|nr:hypothetical protein [Paenibacillus sp.]